MRNIILTTALTLCALQNATAAIVTLNTFDSFPGVTEYTSSANNAYIVGADNYDVVLNQEIQNASQNLNNEEVIYLGAHESTGSNSGSDVIDVYINNGNVGSALTGRVSLVISAAENTTWNFNIDSGVDIRNIFIFGLGDNAGDVQTINISRDGDAFSQSFSLGGTALFDGIDIARSGESVCGFERPGNPQGCNTDLILGENNPFSQGFLTVDSNPSGENYLEDLLGNANGVSSFNASYFVASFDVTIDSTPIPLPAAAYLFSSALALVLGFRKLS